MWTRPRLLTCLSFAASAVFTFAGVTAEREGDAVSFEIPVLPAAADYVDLLPYPAYLALALENNGFAPSQSSRLVVRDGTSFEIRNAVVQYTGRKGAVFFYEASLKLPIGEADAGIRVPVEVDTSRLGNGSVKIRVFPPLSGLLPQAFLNRVEFKLRVLADPTAQRQMLAYFAALRQGQPNASINAMLERILIEAYNRGTPAALSGRDVGDAEPLGEQWALIATLAIWLVIVPVAWLTRGWLRARTRWRATGKTGAS